MRKYKQRFRVKVAQGYPDFVFYAPNRRVAIFYTEMCGFDVISCKRER